MDGLLSNHRLKSSVPKCACFHDGKDDLYGKDDVTGREK